MAAVRTRGADEALPAGPPAIVNIYAKCSRQPPCGHGPNYRGRAPPSGRLCTATARGYVTPRKYFAASYYIIPPSIVHCYNLSRLCGVPFI